MTIHVRWCVEDKGILCWTFEGRWTWAHLRQAIAQTRELGESYTGRVDLIIDVRQMGLPPANLTSGLLEFARMDFGFREDGINVLVGMDVYLKTLWDVLSQRLPASWQVHYAESLDEAYDLIRKNRADV